MDILLILTFIACIGAIYLGVISYRQQKTIQRLVASIESMKIQSKQNTSTQRSVIKGQIAEQLLPLLKTCDYVSSDMRFLGMPIDYIIFEGLTETRDGECYISNIIIADVKTGKASLTKEQKAIKDAIDGRRVSWKTIRIE